MSDRIKSAVIATIITLLVALLWWSTPHPLMIVALGILPIAVWFALKQAFLIVLCFVIFSFFRIHEVIPPLYPLHIPQLMAMGALFVIAWNITITRTLKPYWSIQLTLLVTFFCLVTIGLFFASNRSIAFSEWSDVYVKIFVMTLATAWLLREEKDFSLASRIFCAAGLVVGAVAISNKIIGIGLVEGTRVTIGRELGSILGDPNDLSLVLLFPASFAISMAIEKRLFFWERLLGVIGFIILLWAIIATQSRGGLLGIIGVAMIFLYHQVRSKMLLLSGAAVAIMFLFLLAGIADRDSGGVAEQGIDASAMGRLYAWEAAWGMALDNPLFGVGIDNYYYNYYFYSNHWDGLNHAVHSTWFGVLAETGFLGLLVFIALVSSTFMASMRTLMQSDLKQLAPAIAVAVCASPAGIAGFVVSGTFLTQGFTWPIYLQLAIAVAVMRYVQQQEKSGIFGKMQNNSHNAT